MCGSLLAGAPAAAADDLPPLAWLTSPGVASILAPELALSGSPRYFSPNGDGSSDTTWITYSLTAAAQLHIAISAANGTIVRSWTTAATASTSASVSWDGRTDAGSFVPDGVYTASLSATGEGGTSATATRQIGVDTRVPAYLVQPSTGASLPDLGAPWTVTPAPDFAPTFVSISCGSGYGHGSAWSPDAQGWFRGTIDVIDCAPGANTLTAEISWIDAFGGPQTWVTPPLTVSVNSTPPQAPGVYASLRTVSPDGDGNNDSTNISHQSPRTAQYTAMIVDSQGAVVRTLESNALHYRHEGHVPMPWDGRDDAGALVPDGPYGVSVWATNAAGTGEPALLPIRVDRRLPGASLVRPAADTHLSGTVSWEAAVSPSVNTVVSVRCVRGFGEAPGRSAVEGVATGSLSVANCSYGPNALRLEVKWSDEFGQLYWWISPDRPVIIDALAPQVSWESGSSSFSPNGDGQEDELIAVFALTQSSDVTVTVRSAAGVLVRTLMSATPIDFGTRPLTWDGRRDDGTMAPDGDYFLGVQAANPAATTPVATLHVALNTRNPGSLTAPAPGSRAGATVEWTVSLAVGFLVRQVRVYCGRTDQYQPWQPVGTGGTIRGTLDVRRCLNGDNEIAAQLNWTDSFGVSHIWTTAPTPVVLANTASLSWLSSPGYFSPNGDDQEDTVVLSFAYTQPAYISKTVVDAGGATIRTLGQSVFRYASMDDVRWDGTDDSGAPAPDGAYTVVVTGTNEAGPSTPIRLAVGIDRRIPASLTKPASQDVLAGQIDWAASPAVGFPPARARLTCRFGTSDWQDLGTDGRFVGTLDTTRCLNGADQISLTVEWTDPFGVTHSWTSTRLSATIANIPSAAWIRGPGYFSPNLGGHEDVIALGYTPIVAGTFSLTVVDSTGTVVRHLDTDRVALPGESCFAVWDGADDAGTPLPDGVYTATLLGTNTVGLGDPTTLAVGIERRAPGHLTSPQAGALVTEPTLAWTATVTEGFAVYQISVRCSAGIGVDGVLSTASSYTGTLDVSRCTNGPNSLVATFWWTDPLGRDHWRDATGLPIVLDTPTPPTVTGTITPTPNAAGWVHAPATVTWAVAEPEPSSGAASQPTPNSVSTEGRDQEITSQPSCDPSGNCATGTVKVSVDLTPPTITASLTDGPAGSPAGSKVVRFVCSDALSGVASCPADQPVPSGAPAPVTGTVTDVAGNQATASITVAAPALTSAAPPADARVGTAYTFGIVATGAPAPTFALGSGELPPGVTLSVDGKISGTPTTAGTFSFTVTATSDAGRATSARYTITVAARTSDAVASFVRAAYQDFLGRQPTSSELSTRVVDLNSGGLTREAFLRQLANSPEWLSVIVTKMYRDTLGREPDAGGLATWVEWIRSGRFTVAQAAGLFYSSQEFYQGIGGNSLPSWVTKLYEKLLNRAPDPGGLQLWVSYAADPAFGRSWVAVQFYGSLESRLTRVQNLYRALLQRNPDSTGWPFWADVVVRTGDIELGISLANSLEYSLRAQQRY